MKELSARLQPYNFPLLSLALCILAYGLLSPWLGLYWDDWPLTWFSHEFGPGSFIDFAPYRPVSGWLYSLSFFLLGENPLAWHLYALLWRWLSVLAFWQLLRLAGGRGRWPQVAALLFALYPGFSQQPIAVIYSVYWLYYTVFLASLCLTLLSLRPGAARIWLLAAALLSSAAVMLSTEYFYGLELARGLLIWSCLDGSSRQRAIHSLRVWWPYLLLVVMVFAWRSSLTTQPGNLYSLVLLDKLAAAPLPTLLNLAGTMLGDFFEAGLAAWGRAFETLGQLTPGSLAALAYGGTVLLAGGLCWLAIRRQTDDQAPITRLLPFALGALLLSGLSFWLADLPLRMAFAWDRFTLPLMLPVCLLLALGIEAFARRSKPLTIFALCVLLGLSAGYHFFNANAYREEWERQQAFFKQLVWRAPYIAPHTALLSVENTLSHYTDNSLVAPLNWIYRLEPIGERIPYYIAYLDIRTDAELAGDSDQPIRKSYRYNVFEGQPGDVLVLYYAPPACLRILDPHLDAVFPMLPALLDEQVPRSNLERIATEPERSVVADFSYWQAQPEQSWCYYFQKADLARQHGDWNQVVELGEIAFDLNDTPNHAAERTPFIEGYAHAGNWPRAYQLSQETLRINRFMQPMLCRLWQQIAENTPVSPERAEILAKVEEDLMCELAP